MFSKLFGKKQPTGQYDKDAIETLQMLDVVIRDIHSERFPDEMDATTYVNPPRIAVNAFLGRPPAERFFPIEYEEILSRFAHYVSKNLAAEAMKLSDQMPTMHALMRGIRHEYKLRRVLGKSHDQFNLGREVESTTKTLIQFLNRGATTRTEPMPGEMFGRGKKQGGEDRAALMKEAREMLDGMRRNWDMPTHMTFAVLLANLWREFELKYGSPAAFAALPEAARSAYLTSLLTMSVELHKELERLNSQKADEGSLTDALCHWAASRLLSFYVLAVSTNDREWEDELAPVLDDYMTKGYKISWGSCRLPGEEKLDRSKQADVQPLAHFAR